MCDFENGACYLSQTQLDQFDWEVIQANSESVAPAIDNTYRTEYGKPKKHPLVQTCLKTHLLLKIAIDD